LKRKKGRREKRGRGKKGVDGGVKSMEEINEKEVLRKWMGWRKKK
jgi:hypothetical protein